MEHDYENIKVEDLEELTPEELADIKVESRDLIDDLDDIIMRCDNIINS